MFNANDVLDVLSEVFFKQHCHSILFCPHDLVFFRFTPKFCKSICYSLPLIEKNHISHLQVQQFIMSLNCWNDSFGHFVLIFFTNPLLMQSAMLNGLSSQVMNYVFNNLWSFSSTRLHILLIILKSQESGRILFFLFLHRLPSNA